MAWFHDHPRKAVRAGWGALTTFIIGVIASIGFAFFAISEVKKNTQEPTVRQSLSSSHHHKKIKHINSSTSASHSSNTASDTSIQEATLSSIQQPQVEAPVAPATNSANTQPTKVANTTTTQRSESHTSSVSNYSSSASDNSSVPYSTYTVKSGDNLYKIAVNRGMTLSELLQLNWLSSGASISAGQTLKVRE